MKKKIINIVCVVCAVLCLYFIVCWVDVITHNHTGEKYHKWNIISAIWGKEDKVVTEEPTTAEYTEVTTATVVQEVTTEATTSAPRKVVTTTEITTEATTGVTTTEVPTEYTTTEYVIEEPTTATEAVVATGTDASVDDYELWLLAHLINGEAGAIWCSDTTKYYVGSVVLNRVNHAEFPDSIEGVIYQSGQYACTWDGNFDLEPSDRCWEIARDLLQNGSWLPNDVVFQANFSQGSGVYDYIDGVYFCYR